MLNAIYMNQHLFKTVKTKIVLLNLMKVGFIDLFIVFVVFSLSWTVNWQLNVSLQMISSNLDLN